MLVHGTANTFWCKCKSIYVLWYFLIEDIDEESRNVADEESNEANEQGNPRGIEPDTAAGNSHTHN